MSRARSPGQGAAAVVGDADQQLVRAVPQPHLGRCAGTRVLADVGERFLHDPVHRDGQPAGHRQGRALHCVGDAHACLAGLRHQPRYLRHLGGRAERWRGRVGAQHAEQVAHLGHRLPSGRADLGEGLPGLFRRGVEDVPAAVGLRHHDAEIVRDHVMQLPGDPGALVRGGGTGAGVPLTLGADGPFLKRGEVHPAAGHRLAEHPGAHRRQDGVQAGHEHEFQALAAARSWVPPRGRRREQRRAGGQRRQRDAPGQAVRDRVQQYQDADIGERGLQRAGGVRRPDADDQLGGPDRQRGEIGGQREAAARRHGGGQCKRGRQGGRLVDVDVDAAGHQRHRHRRVAEPAVPAQPGVGPFHGPRVIQGAVSHRGGGATIRLPRAGQPRKSRTRRTRPRRRTGGVPPPGPAARNWPWAECHAAGKPPDDAPDHPSIRAQNAHWW